MRKVFIGIIVSVFLSTGTALAKINGDVAARPCGTGLLRPQPLVVTSLHNPFRPKKRTAYIFPVEENKRVPISFAPRAIRCDGEPVGEGGDPGPMGGSGLPPNDTHYSSQWGLTALDMLSAWDFNFGGGVVVAVIDDGVQYDHEDLAANMWTNSDEIQGNGIDDDSNGFIDDYYGYNFYPDGNPDVFLHDTYGHGSAMAGIIAAVRDNNLGISGVSPESKIMALRIYPSTASFDAGATINAAIQSIYYAVNNGARVINISSIFSFGGFPTLRVELEAAIQYAVDHNAIVVCGSGNKNDSNMYEFPRSFDSVLTIGALDSSLFRWIGTGDEGSTYGYQLDFMAPGANISSVRSQGSNWSWLNNDPAYMSGTGTSNSTAFVSGIVALLLAENPYQNFTDIYRRLKFSAIDKGDPGRDDYYGYGMINPFDALTYDYYADGVVLSRYTPTADSYDIVRKDYDHDLLTLVIDQYDKDMNRAVFSYYSETSKVQYVRFYDQGNNLKRTNEYYADGVSIHYRTYPDGHSIQYNAAGWIERETLSNGDTTWYYQSGNKQKFFKASTGLTSEYLDEDFSGNHTGRVTKVTDQSGNYTLYLNYYKGKNIARFIGVHNGSTTINQFNAQGEEIPALSVINYYGSGVMQSYVNSVTGDLYEFLDEDFYLNQVGRLNKITFTNGRTYTYTYYTGTDTIQTNTIRQDGSILLTESYDNQGILTQKQFPSGDIWAYYSNGNLKSFTQASTGIKYDYLDDNFFQDKTGRLSKITYSDNTYLIIESYHPNSANPKTINKFSNIGTLIGTFEYDPTGTLIDSFGVYTQNEILASSPSYTNLRVNTAGQMVWQSGNDIWFSDGITSRIISTPGTQNKNPRINNLGQVAWQQMYSNYEIVFWNGSTIQRITDNAWNDDTSVTANFVMEINDQGQIVWDVDQSPNNQVYLYDGASVTLLNQSRVWTSQPQRLAINNNGDVVWQGDISSQTDNIYMKPGSSSTVIKVSGAISYCYAADMNATGHVVFQGYNGNDDYDLFFYDGTQLRQITNNNKINDVKPRINDSDQIAWLGGPKGQNKGVYFYDGTVHQITNDGLNYSIIGFSNQGYILFQRTVSKELFLYNGHQSIQLSTNATTASLDKEGNLSWVDTTGNHLYLATIQPYTGTMPDLYNGALSFTRYANGRIESLTFSDNHKEFYRNENFYGNNLGRLSKKVFADGTYETYEYWNDTDQIQKQELFTAGGLIQLRKTFDATGKSLSVEVLNGYNYTTDTIITDSLVIGGAPPMQSQSSAPKSSSVIATSPKAQPAPFNPEQLSKMTMLAQHSIEEKSLSHASPVRDSLSADMLDR